MSDGISLNEDGVPLLPAPAAGREDPSPGGAATEDAVWLATGGCGCLVLTGALPAQPGAFPTLLVVPVPEGK